MTQLFLWDEKTSVGNEITIVFQHDSLIIIFLSQRVSKVRNHPKVEFRLRQEKNGILT